jgi:hypothetical protein
MISYILALRCLLLHSRRYWRVWQPGGQTVHFCIRCKARW